MEPLPLTHLRYAAWAFEAPPRGTGLTILIDGFEDPEDAQAFLRTLLPVDQGDPFTVRH